MATKGEIPFWMRANQYGIVPRGERVLSIRSAWRRDYREALEPPSTASCNGFIKPIGGGALRR